MQTLYLNCRKCKQDYKIQAATGKKPALEVCDDCTDDLIKTVMDISLAADSYRHEDDAEMLFDDPEFEDVG